MATIFADGQTIKSIEVKTDSFVFDSKDNIVLFEMAKNELHYYTNDGILTKIILWITIRKSLHFA